MRGFPGLVAATFLLGACHAQPAEPLVEKAWVRLPAVSGNPGAAYFTLTGGKAADRLVGVSTPEARAEMHESMGGGGEVTSMQPLRDLALPPHGSIAFAPGGRHVMLFGLSPQVKPGTTIPLTLALAGGKRLAVQAKVVGAGDPPPE